MKEKAPKKIVKCEHCNQNFEILKWLTRKFCSKKCSYSSPRNAKISLVGNIYGRLTVIKEAARKKVKCNNKQGYAYSIQWICKCDCGTTKTIVGSSLKRGLTKSCGCLHKDTLKEKRGRPVHQGYIFLTNPDKEKYGPSGRIFEHRIVMMDYLDRQLTKDENVHHINGIRDDNEIDNLELWSTSQPRGQRIQDKIAWAKSILEKYGDS